MKKQTAITLSLLIALGGLAACSTSREKHSENNSMVQSGEKVVGESSESSAQTVKSVTFIGEEMAKDIVAKRLDVAVATIEFKKIELDEENNVWIYEVDFVHGDTQYEAEINAENGDVIKWEKEIKK